MSKIIKIEYLGKAPEKQNEQNTIIARDTAKVYYENTNGITEFTILNVIENNDIYAAIKDSTKTVINISNCLVKSFSSHDSGMKHENNLWIFNKELLAESSIFEGQTKFSFTKFTNNVSFKAAKFLSEANFERSIFCQQAKFSAIRFQSNFFAPYIQFLDFVSFKESKFYKSTYIQYSKFHHNSDFQGSKFHDFANLSNIIVSGNFYFNYASTKKAIQFSYSKFFGKVDCRFSKFVDLTSFDSVIFHSKCTFDYSTFLHHAIFDKSIFYKSAIFIRVRFDKDLRFFNTALLDECSFIESEFQGTTMFGKSIFTKKTRFSGTLFSGSVLWQMPEETDLIKFDDLLLSNLNNFTFEAAFFKKHVDFTGFKFVKLNLGSCIFEHSASFKNCEITKASRETYRIIKHEFLKINNRLDAVEYFKREIEEKWKEAKPHSFEKNLLSAYSYVNDYGTDSKRALRVFSSFTLIFLILFTFMGYGNCYFGWALSDCESFIEASRYTAENLTILLNPTHKVSELHGEISVFGIVISYLFRLYIPIMFFFILQPLKKYKSW